MQTSRRKGSAMRLKTKERDLEPYESEKIEKRASGRATDIFLSQNPSTKTTAATSKVDNGLRTSRPYRLHRPPDSDNTKTVRQRTKITFTQKKPAKFPQNRAFTLMCFLPTAFTIQLCAIGATIRWRNVKTAKGFSMKKGLKIFGIIAIAALIGLSMVGCDSDGSNAPQLTELVVLTAQDCSAGNWNPQTSFPTSAGIGFGIKGNLPGGERLSEARITFKEGGNLVQSVGWDNLTLAFMDPFTYYFGNWDIGPAGSWTLEVYVIDTLGNRSNTLSRNFTMN